MIVPQAVTIDPSGITVAFVEQEEFDTPGGIILAKQLSIPGDVCKDKIDDLMESIRDLVDDALLHRRAPVTTFVDRDPTA